MLIFRRIVGILGLLIAIFCGGCGLYFLNVEPTAVLIGGLPAAIGGLIAWWGLKKPVAEAETTQE